MDARARSFLALVALVGLVPAAAQAGTRVVARTGDPSPDGTGVLFLIETPIVLGASGQVAFSSDIRDAGFLGGFGIFRAGDASDLTLIARASGSAVGPVTGWPAPDGNGYFYPFDTPPLAIDASGRVAFGARLTDTFAIFDAEGVFLGSGGQAGLVQIARGEQLVPDTSDRLLGFGVPAAAPSLNDAGQLAFFANVGDAVPSGAAIVRGDDAPDGLVELARTGQAVPGGGEILQFLVHAATIDAAGDAVFSACLTTGCGAVFRSHEGALTEIVRNGAPSPDGDGTFLDAGFHPPLGNDAGGVAFYATLTGTTGGGGDGAGLFVDDGSGLAVAARRGDLTPAGNGRLLDIAAPFAFDDLGQVLFASTITGAQGGSAAGVFRSEGGVLTAIARVNEPAPGGAGVFSKFDPFTLTLNDAGQAAFVASLDFGDGGGTEDGKGLFLYDDAHGLRAAARVGDVVPGAGRLDTIDFTGATTAQGKGTSGLNDRGELAYRGSAGGDYFVAVVPEPDLERIELAAGAALLLEAFGERRRRAGA